jgi:hypothetical protein
LCGAAQSLVQSQSPSQFALLLRTFYCAPKALIFKLSTSEALASTETKTLRSAKNEAKDAKAKKANETKPTRTKKLMVQVESSPFF